MSKSKKSPVLTVDPRTKKLAELEEKIVSWKNNGRLWDYEDDYVAETLIARDKLFYELNPQLGGLTFNDMRDSDWEAIDKKMEEDSNDAD
jgi:hypothetical protein